MPARARRLARGSAAAGFATLVAAVSHSLADGHAASGIAVGLAFVFALFVCVALAGRRMATWRLALAVAVSQGAFHLVFVTLTPQPVTFAGSHHHETMQLLGTATATDHASVAMWTAHGIAAALTTLALRFGEAGLMTVVRLATAIVRALVTVVTPVAVTRRTLPVANDRIPVAAHVARRSLLFRGPPAVALP